MPENHSEDDQVDMTKEIVNIHIQEIDAIVELLVEKEILTREEYREKVNRMKESGKK